MGQSRTGVGGQIFSIFLLAGLALLPTFACDRPAPAPPATAPSAASARVASLVPAATDLLLAMNAKEQLVAVSNYDGQPNVESLPRVGDYQQIDWEKLASLKPTAMIVQMRPDHMPPGLVQRAESLGMKLVNVRIEQIDDIFTAMTDLATAANQPQAAATLTASLRAELAAVTNRVAGKPRVRTLIVIDADPKVVAGRGTFLNDELELAGGENVLPATLPHWPAIDQETLVSLKPDVILQLLPNASPQVIEQAKSNWTKLADVPAVKNGKVYQLTDWFLLQPGAHVGQTAAMFADRLHGKG